ncbi:MAG: histidine kinase [Bacteroidales bacterium]
MKTRSPLTARKVLLFLLANLVLAILITLFFMGGFGDSLREASVALTWAYVVCVTQWLGHSYIFDLLDRVWSWREQTTKRAVMGILAIIVYAVLAYYIVQVVMYLLVYGELPEEHFRWALRSSIVPIIISLALSMVMLAMGFLQNWKESLLENERMRSEMLMYKYESLQKQINPHFLFNSFNVLSDLVYEDQAKAVSFIGQMSQLFRYVLDSKDKELIPLSEELEFLSSYVYLLKTRFEDKLSVHIDLDPGSADLVVPMTLQLLVENCVKHNEVSREKSLDIKIYRTDRSLVVENNLSRRKQGAVSGGTGLSTLKQQYGFFTRQAIVIRETEDRFAIEVPILTSSAL